MQLSGPEIERQMLLSRPGNPNGVPNIIIKPFDKRCLGSNSYDLHLAPEFKVYKNTIPDGMLPFIPYEKGHCYSMSDWFEDYATYKDSLYHPALYDIANPKFLIDPLEEKEVISFNIPKSGAILNPRFGYLASTIEYTETYNLFPYIDGKSSLGRNFVLNHHTAGRGDDGFCGNWTLEIRVLNPTVVYPGMRIGQIYYEQFIGDRKKYNENPSSHYNGQKGPTPAAPIPVDSFIEDLDKKFANMSITQYVKMLQDAHYANQRH